MEAGELVLYMFFVCGFATLLQHPASPVRNVITSNLARRALYGLAMAAMVIGIIMTPWGKQSGGHFNPAITLTFYRLGKVEFWDAWFYVVAQFLGAISGVCLARFALLGRAWQPRGTLRGDRARQVRQRYGICCRIDDLFHPDAHRVVCNQQ